MSCWLNKYIYLLIRSLNMLCCSWLCPISWPWLCPVMFVFYLMLLCKCFFDWNLISISQLKILVHTLTWNWTITYSRTIYALGLVVNQFSLHYNIVLDWNCFLLKSDISNCSLLMVTHKLTGGLCESYLNCVQICCKGEYLQ